MKIIQSIIPVSTRTLPGCGIGPSCGAPITAMSPPIEGPILNASWCPFLNENIFKNQKVAIGTLLRSNQ